jgi:hypothetical protein
MRFILQPDDRGTIAGVGVNRVLRKRSQAVHYVDKALEAGSSVQVELDWNRRFDHMQQHSGWSIMHPWLATGWHHRMVSGASRPGRGYSLDLQYTVDLVVWRESADPLCPYLRLLVRGWLVLPATRPLCVKGEVCRVRCSGEGLNVFLKLPWYQHTCIPFSVQCHTPTCAVPHPHTCSVSVVLCMFQVSISLRLSWIVNLGTRLRHGQ